MDAHMLQWIWLSITLTGIVVGGVLLVKLFRYEARWLVRKFSNATTLDPTMHAWVDDLSRSARSAIILIGVILAIVLSMRVLEVPIISPHLKARWQPEAFFAWIVEHGIGIVLTVAVAGLCIRIVHKLISHLAMFIRPHDESPAAQLERAKRIQTVSAILQHLASFIIAIVATLMVLAELGVNITPILTSLGVVGVAVGFGAQQLVGDLIAGFFHIFENQIRVGDVAVINGVGGQVEEIRLRTTVLRAFDGTVHIFRNGSVTTLANMTKDFSYFAMDLPMSYRDDTDRIVNLVQEVGADLQNHSKLKQFILEPVEVLGVESFTDSAVTLRFRMKTLPIKQWEVGREFRRRLKIRLDQEGIEIPAAYHYLLRAGIARREAEQSNSKPGS